MPRPASANYATLVAELASAPEPTAPPAGMATNSTSSETAAHHLKTAT